MEISPIDVILAEPIELDCSVENVTKAIANLIKQDKRSFDSERDMCVYFDSNTKNRCIVGHMMSESDAERLTNEIVKVLESNKRGHVRDSAHALIECGSLVPMIGQDKIKDVEEITQCLSALQSIHDHSVCWEYDFEQHLKLHNGSFQVVT